MSRAVLGRTKEDEQGGKWRIALIVVTCGEKSESKLPTGVLSSQFLNSVS